MGASPASREDGKAQFAGSLRNMCALSDLKMGRLLDLIDAWARDNGLDGSVAPPHRLPPTRVEASPPLGMQSRQERHPDDHLGHRLPSGLFVAGRAGAGPQGLISHDGGVSDAPASYLMGMQFLRRRKSALIDGAGDDARDLSAHLAAYLDNATRRLSA